MQSIDTDVTSMGSGGFGGGLGGMGGGYEAETTREFNFTTGIQRGKD